MFALLAQPAAACALLPFIFNKNSLKTREEVSLVASSMLPCCRRTRLTLLPPPHLLLVHLLLLVGHSLLATISAASANQAEQPAVRILYPNKGDIFSGCNWINFTAVVQVNNTFTPHPPLLLQLPNHTLITFQFKHSQPKITTTTRSIREIFLGAIFLQTHTPCTRKQALTP